MVLLPKGRTGEAWEHPTSNALSKIGDRWTVEFSYSGLRVGLMASAVCGSELCLLLQDQVEAPDGCRPGAVGRGGQLRRFPTPLRRASLRLLAISWSGTGGGACGPQHSGPVLPTSGCSSSGGQHAAEAAAVPSVPGGGYRPGIAWAFVRLTTPARPRRLWTGVPVQLLQQPSVTSEPTTEPTARQQAQLRGGGLVPSGVGRGRCVSSSSSTNTVAGRCIYGVHNTECVWDRTGDAKLQPTAAQVLKLLCFIYTVLNTALLRIELSYVVVGWQCRRTRPLVFFKYRISRRSIGAAAPNAPNF